MSPDATLPLPGRHQPSAASPASGRRNGSISGRRQQFAQKAAKPASEETPFAVAGDEEKPAAKQEANADAKDLQTVVAEGTGTTEDAALKDAFRQAVQQVVGAVVDGETVVKNDELITDKVLTYSDGLVKKWDQLTKKESGGVVRLKIKAVVHRRSVVAKLKAANITVRSVDGKGMFSEVAGELQGEKDASALILKALEGYPANVLKAAVAQKPKIEDRSDKEATLGLEVKVAVDREKYDQFQKRLVQQLEGISLRKGEWLCKSEEETDESAGKIYNSDIRDARFTGCLRIIQTGHGDDLPTRGSWGTEAVDFSKETIFVINTSRDRLSHRTVWRWFHVPIIAAPINPGATLAVECLDSQQNTVTQDRLNICYSRHYGSQLNPAIQVHSCPEKNATSTWTQDQNVKYPNAVVILGPYLLDGGGNWLMRGFHTDLIVPLKLKVGLEDVKNLENVRCTVTASEGPKPR